MLVQQQQEPPQLEAWCASENLVALMVFGMFPEGVFTSQELIRTQ
jgi:hypothetical protein